MMRLLTSDNGEWRYFDDHKLANAIITSPMPIYKVEVFSDKHGGRYIDITYKFKGHIRENNMKKVENLPKFDIGEVIDLSYKYGGLPNRIYITSIFMREQDDQWNYSVILENTGEQTTMSESFIDARLTRHTSPVYKNPQIKKRIKDGWRFCGNFDDVVAQANAKILAENDKIDKIRLYPAINPANQFVNGQSGIWIKWANIINNDGRILCGKNTVEFIDIK